MNNKIVLRLDNSVDIQLKPNFKHPAKNVQAFFSGDAYSIYYKPLYGNMAFDINLRQTPKRQISLTLSLCPAKVLFGNNLFEVKKQDFELLLHTICNMLAQEGWLVSPQHLRQHYLSGIDYAKVFASYYHEEEVIKLVDEVENHRRLKKAHTRFSNGGQCSAFQYAKRRLYIYDKTQELSSDKRLPEKFKSYVKALPYKFFRWEYNMRSPKEIARELKKQKINISNTFENLFDESIGQKILTYYISDIVERMKKIEIDTLQDMYYSLVQKKNIHGTKQSLSFLGYHLGVEQWGQQELKNMLLASSDKFEVSRTLTEYRKQDFSILETVKNISLEMTKTLTDMIPIQDSLPQLQTLDQYCGVSTVSCPRNTAGATAHA